MNELDLGILQSRRQRSGGEGPLVLRNRGIGRCSKGTPGSYIELMAVNRMTSTEKEVPLVVTGAVMNGPIPWLQYCTVTFPGALTEP